MTSSSDPVEVACESMHDAVSPWPLSPYWLPHQQLDQRCLYDSGPDALAASWLN